MRIAGCGAIGTKLARNPLDRIRCLAPGWPASAKKRVARRVALAYPSRSMETARARHLLRATFAVSFGFAFRR
jgi:beta-lactamase regulating signal transducer with metallopeptidase domain